MSVESSRDLVARLHEVDEHYARHEPARGAETRLLARLSKTTDSSRKPLAWRTIWRPLVVGACLAAVVISLHDEISRARRSYFRPLQPNVPAASTDVHIPAPKTPRKQDPVFHDAIIPTPRPTYENRHDIAPSMPLPQPPQVDDSVDASQPRRERMPRMFLPYRSRPFDAQRMKMRSFDSSSPEWYWSGAPVPKSETPLSLWGGSSSTSSASRRHEKASEPNTMIACRSTDYLKTAADLDCSEKGLMLTELTLLEPCGNGGFRRETHECIEAELEACFTDTISDGKACQDPGLLKMLAYEKCTAAGLQLIDLVYDFESCNGGMGGAKYTCCAPAVEPPAPNPPSCHKLAPIDSATCKDLGTLKQEASDMCAAENGYLFDLHVGVGCPDGQASQVIVVCCDW